MAKIYWNSIKRGRAFDSIPYSMKDAVKAIAVQEVNNGIISVEDYKKFIGDEFVEA